ncbi:T3SS (YopN, CesT) and YbjN peptide-binding chaperone 1 [Altericista sp. CCNU0014]|uniref:T3SS (YopN, CesT) and YbjN peptide-binding chaperone 1 n=1 Tax=Altericista sp. CCNU0014 TaxID=3082949 RepID=UPI00384F8391
MRLIQAGWIVSMAVVLAGSGLSRNPVAGSSLPFDTAALAAPVKQTIEAKIGQFLERFGGPYTKAADAVWVVPFKGKALANFDVFIATSSDSNLLIIGATVAKKQNLKLSQALLHRLLKYNHTADYVKVGLDDDEDLFARAELNAKTMDFESFKEVLEQVGAVADELYAQIKPNLSAAPQTPSESPVATH